MRRSRSPVYGLRVAPQALQVVVLPGAGRENVDQEIPVIHQDPVRIGVSFDTQGKLPGIFETVLDLVGDSLDLARVGPAADHKGVDKTGDPAQVQNPDVPGLLIVSSLRGLLPQGSFGGSLVAWGWIRQTQRGTDLLFGIVLHLICRACLPAFLSSKR